MTIEVGLAANTCFHQPLGCWPARLICIHLLNYPPISAWLRPCIKSVFSASPSTLPLAPGPRHPTCLHTNCYIWPRTTVTIRKKFTDDEHEHDEVTGDATVEKLVKITKIAFFTWNAAMGTATKPLERKTMKFCTKSL
jgi:hypothetical protein